MNRKQIVVAWTTVVLVCFLAIIRIASLDFMGFTKVQNMTGFFLLAISVIIIGGLVIYSLRDKKRK